MLAPYLQKKKGYWIFKRRVPDEYKAVDHRDHIYLSTKIRVADDPRAIRAKQVVSELNATAEALWEAKPPPDKIKQESYARRDAHKSGAQRGTPCRNHPNAPANSHNRSQASHCRISAPVTPAQDDGQLRQKHLAALSALGFSIEANRVVPPKNANSSAIIAAITTAFQEACKA